MAKKKTVAQIVSENILAKLEQGEIPWQRPWKQMFGGAPMSYAGRSYRGVNVLLTALSGRSGPFITDYMAKQKGGKIKEEEKDNWTLIVFFKLLKKENNLADGSKERVTIPLMRYTRAWSLEQTEGVPEPAWLAKRKAKALTAEHKPLEGCEALWGGYKDKPQVNHGGDRAFYAPALDQIGMPIPEAFKSSEAYYATLFHEGIHSTGHSDRLGRLEESKALAPFGSEDYSKEELVAEIGAAMLAAHAGIDCPEVTRNSTAYLQSWIKRIKTDPDLIVKASSLAQKAVDYIIGTVFDSDDE